MKTTTLPADFASRMQAELGPEYEAFAAALMTNIPTALRVNTLKCDMQKASDAAGLSLTPVPWANDGYYVENPAVRPGKSPLHDAGAYYIQEPSAMIVAAKAAPTPIERVLDLCAAPGGKTTALAAAMRGKGLLIANDPEQKRAEILSENVERMGLSNVIVTCEYPEKLAEKFPGFFNKIIVDAPCSGEGMFGKEPDAIPKWSTDLVRERAELQHNILSSADEMLAPGGKLIYSTCTFAKEEDENQMQRFLDEHRDYLMRFEKKLYPHKLRGLGHYVCVLEKPLPFVASYCADFCITNKYNEPDDAMQLMSMATFRRNRVTTMPLKKEQKNSIKLKLNREQLVGWADFYKDAITNAPRLLPSNISDRLTSFGDNLYLMPEAIDLNGLHVLRAGLLLGTIDHNRFKPAHSLALHLKPEEAQSSFDLSLEQAAAYIRGETIACPPTPSGWVLVCVCGISLAWGKASGGVIKNHYPKGLRHN